MTGYHFFEDEQPTNELPQWATITQVSDFLAVPRSAVRSAVRRAVTNNEDWVKKEIDEGNSSHYLIDTTHEIYKSHEQRWKQSRGEQEEGRMTAAAEWYSARNSSLSSAFLQEPYADPYVYPYDKHYPGDVLHRWTKFRQRLYSWGIQIFQNILAEEEQENLWQWRWGDLHGGGYSNEEEAVIAALESRLRIIEDEDEDQVLEHLDLFPHSAPQAQKHRFLNFFNRKNDASAFS